MTDTHFLLAFPLAYGEPSLRAQLKSENSHFIVHEQLGFVPSGDGEHSYLELESNGENTQWIAEQMATALGFKAVDIGFCGLKDRHAITRQWFSIYDPKHRLQPSSEDEVRAALAAALPNSQLLTLTRGQAKLRRGMHAGNGFIITLLLEGELGPQNMQSLEAKLHSIKTQGVPNYFGLQRFGRNGNNLVEFERFLHQQNVQREADLSDAGSKKRRKPRKPKGIILSSARSFLFNKVLAARVNSNTWCDALLGDVLMSDVLLGNVTVLGDAQTQLAQVQKPLKDLPTAPLWGRGRSQTSQDALMVENAALEPLIHWANALEHLGLNQERRSLCSLPRELAWSFDNKDERSSLRLIFSLPPGEYATGVLREICDCYEPNRF